MAERDSPSNNRSRLGPVATAMLLLPLLWLVAMFGVDLPERLRLAIGNWTTVLPAMLASVYAWLLSRLAHLGERQRRGWLLVAIALTADAFGFAAFGLYEAVLGLDPTYNLVNLPFYGYFIAMFAGLLLLTPPSHTTERRDAGGKPTSAAPFL